MEWKMGEYHLERQDFSKLKMSNMKEGTVDGGKKGLRKEFVSLDKWVTEEAGPREWSGGGH